MAEVHVLYHPGVEKIGRYLLYPLLVSEHRRAFHLTADPADLVAGDRPPGRSSVLVMGLRYFRHQRGFNEEAMWRGLRDRFETLAFFDTIPSAAHLDARVLARVDRYFKSLYLRDASTYRRSFVGETAWTDWFHREVHPLDDDARVRSTPAIDDPADLSKLRLAWNIGVGLYPRTSRVNRLWPRLEESLGPRWAARVFRRRTLRFRGSRRRRPGVSARMSTSVYTHASVRHHRRVFLDAIAEVEGARLGWVRLPRYNLELRRVAAVLSPFGYGEVCFRDFEAAIYGAGLLKPSTAHIRTWPDLYADDSYYPLAWDGSDTGEVAAVAQADALDGQGRARAAFARLRDAHRGLDARVERLLEELEPASS